MKKTNLFITLFFITVCLFGQSIKESELIGKWNVVNLEGTLEMPEAQKEMIASLKRAFKESTFEFKSDHNFTLDIDFIGIEDMILKVHWNYIREKSIIVIQEWKDKEKLDGSIMEIKVKNIKGKILFELTESPFILEVEK